MNKLLLLLLTGFCLINTTLVGMIGKPNNPIARYQSVSADRDLVEETPFITNNPEFLHTILKKDDTQSASSNPSEPSQPLVLDEDINKAVTEQLKKAVGYFGKYCKI